MLTLVDASSAACSIYGPFDSSNASCSWLWISSRQLCLVVRLKHSFIDRLGEHVSQSAPLGLVIPTFMTWVDSYAAGVRSAPHSTLSL